MADVEDVLAATCCTDRAERTRVLAATAAPSVGSLQQLAERIHFLPGREQNLKHFIEGQPRNPLPLEFLVYLIYTGKQQDSRYGFQTNYIWNLLAYANTCSIGVWKTAYFNLIYPHLGYEIINSRVAVQNTNRNRSSDSKKSRESDFGFESQSRAEMLLRIWGY
ncbi:hypothetical protein J6590_054522 [Homalodisca vitripennis]|nr:hypothetical protein J6590_054522 [Homalodisca vitripennis]